MPSTLSNNFKLQVAKKAIDLTSDNIKILLMRDDFTFNQDLHYYRKNIKADTGTTTLNINASLQITRVSGSFIDDGFVAGNKITLSGFTNGGNNTTKIISSVSASAITVTDTSGLVEETGSGDERCVADDELGGGNGYTQDNYVLSLLDSGISETEDKAYFDYDNVSWTASGGSIGPSPGAILYDDTSTDDVIIGYIDFGLDKTAPDGSNFNINGISIKIG